MEKKRDLFILGSQAARGVRACPSRSEHLLSIDPFWASAWSVGRRFVRWEVGSWFVQENCVQMPVMSDAVAQMRRICRAYR